MVVALATNPGSVVRDATGHGHGHHGIALTDPAGNAAS
jgi:hypothetical protein